MPKNLYRYILLFISPILIAQQTDFSGLYSGNFKHGKFRSDIEFDIHKINDQYEIKFNSLSQNAFGIPAGDVLISGDTIHFALQSDYYRYEFSCEPFGENVIAMISSSIKKRMLQKLLLKPKISGFGHKVYCFMAPYTIPKRLMGKPFI